MALISLPTQFGVKEKSFQIGYKQQITPGGGGYIQTIDRASPMWTADYTTGTMDEATKGIVQAALDALEGAMGSFLAYDPARLMPLAYANQPLAATPWGSPTCSAYSFANSQLTLSSMTPGAIVSYGDYISIYDGVAYWLYRSRSQLLVDGTGTVTLNVSPRPYSATLTGKAVVYRKAPAEMKIPNGIKETSAVGQGTVLTFTGVQFIKR